MFANWSIRAVPFSLREVDYISAVCWTTLVSCSLGATDVREQTTHTQAAGQHGVVSLVIDPFSSLRMRNVFPACCRVGLWWIRRLAATLAQYGNNYVERCTDTRKLIQRDRPPRKCCCVWSSNQRLTIISSFQLLQTWANLKYWRRESHLSLLVDYGL